MNNEENIGRIMSNYAYLGTAIGIAGAYAYLNLYKTKKVKLAIAALITLGGLSLGGYLGAEAVKRQKL